jgi:hypothetical protein
MKKVILASLLLILTLNSFAQNYIKVKADFKIDSIKIFKGEIFQLENSNQIIFNNSPIKIGSSKYESISNININADKNLLIQKIDSTHFQIDVASIHKSKDSIKIINSQTGTEISIDNNNQIKIADCGQEFRIVTPNHPTIFFTVNEIQESNTTVSQEPIIEENKSFIDAIPVWLTYSIGLLILLGILALIFKKKIFEKKYPKYETYTGNKFSDFAMENNITVESLFKMNKQLNAYKNMNQNEQNKFKSSLRRTSLIIGYEKEPSENDSPSIMETAQQQFPSRDNNNNNNNNTNNREIENKLSLMERTIISEIRTLSSNKEADRKIDELEKKVKQQLEKEDQLQKNIIALNEDKNSIITKLEKFSRKVIETEYLTNYTRLASDFFNLASSSQQLANETYQKLAVQDPENAAILGDLLLKFQTNTSLKIGNWEEIINEINENKITSNTHLINSFRQIEKDEDKLSEFKRILFKQVLEKYAGNLLIIIEELSKLSKFTNKKSHIIEDCEASFSKLSIELQNKLNVLGFEVNYLPLFANYEAYAAHILKVNQECSLPFKKLNNIPKDTVLEIVSYGFGNEKTKIILV